MPTPCALLVLALLTLAPLAPADSATDTAAATAPDSVPELLTTDQPTQAPEPSTALLAGLGGLVILALFVRRK